MDGGDTVAENTISSWWEEPRGGEQCHLPGELILFSRGREKKGHPVQRWEEAEIAFCHLINNQPIYSL